MARATVPMVPMVPMVPVVSVVSVVFVLFGCSSPVEVPVPDAPESAVTPCTDLAAALPTTLVEQEARETDPRSPLTAAWGTPAIELRCGVPRPAALTPTSQLISVNGVDWFAEELTEGYLFTTYGRAAYVEVTVPDDYEPEIGPVTELSSAVADTVPTRPEPE